jgi:beta-glucuronidase
MSRVTRRTLITGCIALSAVGMLAGGCADAHGGKPPGSALPAPVPLTSGWSYLPDPHNVGVRHGWAMTGAPGAGWSPVAIPNDFNPVVDRQEYAGRIGWYKVAFTGPSLGKLTSWWIRFEQVRRNARVWLNGRSIGGNSDAYAPFALQATTLRPGQRNLLVVRVDNLRNAASFPEDWWNWGGIVRPVTLEPVGRIALADLGVMPELACGYKCGDLLVTGRVQNMSRAPLRPQLVVNATSPGGVESTGSQQGPLINPGASVQMAFRVPVRGTPQLWGPGHPALYKVNVLTKDGGHVEQSDALNVGMRSLRVQGGAIYLNGKRLWLHGASIHEDIPGHGAALTDRDIATIVGELKSAGANITRAHYLLSDRMLDALDAAGIMVWTQPPVDHADGVLLSATGRSEALAVLGATIKSSRSHASVVINSVGNELSPTPDTVPGTRRYLAQAVSLAHKLDPTAPVALDTYGYTNFPAQATYATVDVLGISSYFGWYKGLPGHTITRFDQLQPFLELSHEFYPRQALVVSEFGAEARYSGPATTKGTYAFQTDYLKQTFSVLSQLPFMNGGIYWTLREFAVNPWWVGGADLPPADPPDGIHHKGLITYAGADKPAFAAAQKLFADPPAFVH